MERPSTEYGRQPVAVEAPLEATLRSFTEAFNAFDARKVASFWADDGTLINPIGHAGRGRAEIERVFREDAQSILSGTTSRFSVSGVRKLAGDCVLLDLDHEAQNARMPDGSVETMRMHVVMLARKSGDRWQWLDARPYAFLRPPPSLH